MAPMKTRSKKVNVSVVPVKMQRSFIQSIPFSVVCTIIEVHLASFPQCAASLLSSCRDLWKNPSRLTIDLHTLRMQDFSLWPVFSNSVRYYIKGVNLVYKSQKTCLPPELTSRCAFLHTLDLSKWRRLKSISGLGQCGSLHTLNLSCCNTLTDVSGLGQCGSLTTHAQSQFLLWVDQESCQIDEGLKNVSTNFDSKSWHTTLVATKSNIKDENIFSAKSFML